MDVFRDVDVVPSYFSAEGSDDILNLEQLQELLTNNMAQSSDAEEEDNGDEN